MNDWTWDAPEESDIPSRNSIKQPTQAVQEPPTSTPGTRQRKTAARKKTTAEPLHWEDPITHQRGTLHYQIEDRHEEENAWAITAQLRPERGAMMFLRGWANLQFIMLVVVRPDPDKYARTAALSSKAAGQYSTNFGYNSLEPLSRRFMQVPNNEEEHKALLRKALGELIDQLLPPVKTHEDWLR